MNRRILSILLTFTIIITSLGIPSWAQAKGIMWTIEGTSLTIEGSGNIEEQEAGTYPWSGEEITSVTISEGIKSVPANAFKDMPSVNYVSLPRGLQTIGDNAFAGCRLNGLMLPDTVSSIGDNAIPAGTKITGITGSYAADYASSHGMPFRYPVVTSNTATAVFNGYGIEPEVTVRYSDYSACDMPYEVSYEDNIEAGTAYACVSFPAFTEKIKGTFTITPVSIEGVEVTTNEESPLASGGAKAGLVMKYNGRTLTRNKDYTLEYIDNDKIGVATVIVTGMGSYYGQISRQYNVIPAAVYVNSAVISTGKIKVGWSHAGSESRGYELQIGLDKAFENCDTYDIQDVDKLSKTVKKVCGKSVSKKKKYYFRIRTYAVTGETVLEDGTVEYEKVYSVWSDYTKRAEYVKNAQKWLGYDEKNGKHKIVIDKYNSVKPRPVNYKVKYWDAWCATFVTAVAIVTGITKFIPRECSCPRMIDLMKKKGIWVENDAYVPRPGDLIFYDWQDSGKGDCKGESDHVGIVVSVKGSDIKVIEGNKYISSRRTYGVAYRTIKVNGRYIRGYGVPKC